MSLSEPTSYYKPPAYLKPYQVIEGDRIIDKPYKIIDGKYVILDNKKLASKTPTSSTIPGDFSYIKDRRNRAIAEANYRIEQLTDFERFLCTNQNYQILIGAAVFGWFPTATLIGHYIEYWYYHYMINKFFHPVGPDVPSAWIWALTIAGWLTTYTSCKLLNLWQRIRYILDPLIPERAQMPDSLNGDARFSTVGEALIALQEDDPSADLMF